MQFEVGCRLRYRVNAPVTFVFNFAVAANACQQVDRQSLQVNPETAVEEVHFAEGSRHMRLQVSEGEVAIDYRAVGTLLPVRVPMADLCEVPPAELPLDFVHYIYPSRYCPSDQLLNFAARQFGSTERGYARVAAISDWIRANV